MGISDWFYYSLSCLDYTLFYIGLHRPKTAKLVVVGLENAGKSSLLQNLANRPPGFAVDTSHPGLETLVRGSISFTALDVGGHHQTRELWTKTICGASAVVFMVDAQDAE
ncbi:hypothetical protein N656DRAFT_782353 [Canariomyces notabilis]|uniref:Uncharacterized protein n=1 Tax=Canariomyces notabilis TaxID=2074819 RepID=A0AAN6QLC8_9PEZI|nr:hypothetical protein N656DRAFT_782353 [Canariomyces arenarius]